jgi:hypothetical protein
VTRFTSQDTATNTPITEMVVNSLITDPADGTKVTVDRPVTIGGIAWDGGYGIRAVEVSSDGGKSWAAATLGEDLGRFAFRTFSYSFSPNRRGKQTIMARASNAIGQGQTSELIHNPAGYHHNVYHGIVLDVA